MNNIKYYKNLNYRKLIYNTNINNINNNNNKSKTNNSYNINNNNNIKILCWNVNGGLNKNNINHEQIIIQINKYKPNILMAQESLGFKGHCYKLRKKMNFQH